MLETNISLAPNRVNLPPSEWTDERVTRLTQLWQDGLTASQVAAELGGFEHCRDGGRSAVIGKVHRLHLPERSAPQRYPRIPRRKRDRAASDVNRGVTQRIVAKMLKVRQPSHGGGAVMVESVIREEPPPRPEFLGIALLDLKRRMCRFPQGEGASISFCGQKTISGESWCRDCYRIVYQAPRPITPRPYLPTGGGKPAVF